jgi:GTP-binding protein Era
MHFKSGFVGLLGRPNVGKSTLLNIIAKQQIAITSRKAQTTRNVIRGIVTDEESQIIFVDTPGIHSPSTKLGRFMVKEAVETIADVDVVIFLVDATNKSVRKENMEIIERLKKNDITTILVLNKIDLVSKEQLLPMIKEYSEIMKFHSILPISAIKKDGVDELLLIIKKILKEGPKFFPEDMITDQPERVIVSEIVRGKLLNSLNEEVPHGIGVDVVSFKEREGKDIIDIQVNIYCEKSSHKSIIIGKNGKMLKMIGSKARADIEKFLGAKVFMELWVKVKQDWRNDNFMLK